MMKIRKFKPLAIFCGCTSRLVPDKSDIYMIQYILVFSSPEPKAHGELIVYQSICRLSVGLWVCVSTFSNMNISETSRPIATTFYLKHHWVGGKAALGFGPDRIRTLVSMATDSSHRIIMGKT